MHLIIDGYNLLHDSDLLGSSRGINWLERARERLLRSLEKHLPVPQLPKVTVVFDRHSSKPIDADSKLASGVRVLYAVDYPEADDLIEVLIARHPQPKQLTVVSSDHRLQKAASRRKASFSDADAWYDRLTSSRLPQQETGSRKGKVVEKPSLSSSDEEIAAWLSAFTSKIDEKAETERTLSSLKREEPEISLPDEKTDLEIEGYNPFPDNYGSDLLDED